MELLVLLVVLEQRSTEIQPEIQIPNTKYGRNFDGITLYNTLQNRSHKVLYRKKKSERRDRGDRED